MFLRLIRSFFPLECPLCGGVPFDGSANMFCAECLAKLPLIFGETCPGCGGPMDGILEVCPSCLRESKRPWSQAYALFRMEESGRETVSALKYRKRPELARPLGHLLGSRIAMMIRPNDIDAIVPTPLHWTRLLERGYNQAELISRMIAAELHVPVKTAMIRSRKTKQQAKLPREERLTNLKGAFRVKDPASIRGLRLLLVDDVLTTGSTLSEATGTLLQAGAAEVRVAVLGRR